ncbi:hypothetical protein A2U01_0103638, partial [Trifolium medium]|nr:hypothetical protein [Trifolium medium]
PVNNGFCRFGFLRELSHSSLCHVLHVGIDVEVMACHRRVDSWHFLWRGGKNFYVGLEASD